MTNHPIVPGLASLHSRLGLNSSYFLLFAFLDAGLWHSVSHHVLNGLLVLALALQIGVALSGILKGGGAPESWDLLVLLLGVPLVGQCLYHSADTSADFAIFATGFVIGVEFYQLVFSNLQKHELNFSAFRIVTLCALGICFKLSFAAIGLTGMIAVGKLIRSKSAEKRAMILSVTTAFLQLFPWLIRGVILTGYVLFPLRFMPLGVDWRISQAKVLDMSEWIKSSARMPLGNPRQVLSDWRWFEPWCERLLSERANLFEVILPILLCAIGILLLWRRKFADKSAPIRLLLFLFPIFCAVVFWFVTAPDPRFAGISFWLLGAGVLTIALVGLPLRVNARVLMLAGIMISLLISRIYYAPLIVRPTGNNGLTPIPVAALKQFTTNSRLVLFVPLKPDQCWDSPLPCTPYPSPNLRLRRPNEIRNGFLAP